MGRLEANEWQRLYRVLFDWNVAGTALTKVDGRIVDCNEPCAQIFGFDSRDEMLTQSAWDFYFDRAEREVLLNRLCTQRNCPAEEVCLRGRGGAPVWVLATRSVASFAGSRPELLQGTVIDITAEKKAQARLRDIKNAESRARMSDGKKDQMADLSQRLATLLQHANTTLQPANLPRMGKPEIQEFLLVLEQMKMLMSELEIIRLVRE